MEKRGGFAYLDTGALLRPTAYYDTWHPLILNNWENRDTARIGSRKKASWFSLLFIRPLIRESD